MTTAPAPSAAPRDSGREAAFERVWDSPPGLMGILREVNNIPIARRYMIAGFAFFVVGGVLGLLMRIQLGSPENTFLDAETYNQLFTMHGTTMMFLFVIPFIEAVANYLLPLVLGTRDMPFPRLTALSFWTYVFGGIFLYSSFLFGAAPNGGWFAYVPLNGRQYSPGINMDFWDIGLSVAEISAMGAAAELIVAVLRMRAPGMRINQIPVFGWAMLVTAFMIIFGFTPLIVGTAMLELDRKGLTTFFVPGAGGDPLLWQHLFWIFGHPEVYIMYLPAVGMVSHIVQVFARRPLVSYTLMVASMIVTGFLSFGLWVHHMFAAGLSHTAMGFFTAASMTIAIPNGIQMFGWISTIWLGRPVWRTPLLFVMGFIVIFLIGGISGVMVAAVPFDTQAHDSYFVVAHFHYVLIGGVVFPLIAALYYWLPKITGHMLSERLGRWNFWLMFIFFNVAFFPMHLAGLSGMPRRVYTYSADAGWEVFNLISTIGAFGFATGVLLFVVNVVWSLKRGILAGPDPWQGDTLEWTEPSPPPNAQFKFIPVITERHPLWDQANRDAAGTKWESLLTPLQSGPTTWRGALVVDTLNGEPRAIVHVPGPTIAPFVMSLGFTAIFVSALLDSLSAFVVGAVLSGAALIRWFWPQASERRALAEFSRTPAPDRLPLAIAGPLSSGYWGTLIFLLVLLTAVVTVVASYFYLADGPGTWPAGSEYRREGVQAMVAAILLAGGAAGTWWFRRGVMRGALTGTRFGLAVAVLCHGAFLWLTVIMFRGSNLAPSSNAYASAVLGVFGMQWVIEVVVIAMVALALAWSILRPGDDRGDSVALNSALVAFFAAGSGVLSLAVVFLARGAG